MTHGLRQDVVEGAAREEQLAAQNYDSLEMKPKECAQKSPVA